MWKMMGRSVRGALHVRNRALNQDAVSFYQHLNGHGPEAPFILAVSDGHGGNKYFRSDIGSQLAVQCAIKVLRVFYDETQGIADAARVEKIARENLGELIHEAWLQEVMEHTDRDPIKIWELTRLAFEEGEQSRSLVEKYPRLAYGATVLAAMATPHWTLYLALGDGTITCIKDQKPYLPLGPSETGDSNVTESLVNGNARQLFKIAVEPAETRADMVILTTDGYENSYPNPADFMYIIGCYHGFIQSNGPDWPLKAAEKIDQILAETTLKGSGDDITLGILYDSPE